MTINTRLTTMSGKTYSAITTPGSNDKPANTRIRKPQVAKHQPRTSDGIKHPVMVRHLGESA